MDKLYDSPASAIHDLKDGATVAVSGFGLSAGSPRSLLAALRDRGSRELCLVGNGIVEGCAPIIVGGQASNLIMSFTHRGNQPSAADELLASGAMSLEMVPQGTLVERLRAGGAGLAGIFTPTGLNTPIAEGKDVRYFEGKPYLLETAIRVDYALISAHCADRMGNVEFRGANRHFGPSFAKAARVAIVEVDEILETGELPPERVNLPGIFVGRVVRKTVPSAPPSHGRRRPIHVAREYNGKRGWTRLEMAEQAAELLPESSYVNLGTGLPTYLSLFVADRDVILHGENGILGYGEILDGDGSDLDIFNAGCMRVAPRPGVSYFDSVTAFEMARSGRVQMVVLGAYQVDAEGSLANWATPGMTGGGIGGAMDLVASGSTLMVVMEHWDREGRAKLVERCTYPLTGKGCVDIVVTDLAVLRRHDGVFAIERTAPGFTAEEVLSLTEMRLRSIG